jgi:glutathione S-transferase
MITLYQLSSSPFTEKARRALNYKGLSFQTHEVVRAVVGNGDYDHVSPTRKFPTITDGETNVWDSTDILRHLERAYPQKPIIPTDPRLAAIAHVIEDWADESLYFYEILMRAGWEHNLDASLETFAKSMPHIPRDKLRPGILAGATALTTTQGLGRKPRAQIRDDADRHFLAVDGLLEGQDWLVGDKPTTADFAVAGQLNALLFAVEAREALARSRHIQPWLERLDVVAPIFARSEG